MSLACAFKLDDTNAKGQTVMPAAWIKQQYLTPLELDQWPGNSINKKAVYMLGLGSLGFFMDGNHFEKITCIRVETTKSRDFYL